MFIREIAALVAAFKGISENTEAEASSTGGPFSVKDSPSGVLTGEEGPLRRALKHGRQYVGLSGLGRKGTVVDAPQSAQTAWRRWVRVDRIWRLGRDSTGIRKQTPWHTEVTQMIQRGANSRECRGLMVRCCAKPWRVNERASTIVTDLPQGVYGCRQQ